jgi:hypothetical protein
MVCGFHPGLGSQMLDLLAIMLVFVDLLAGLVLLLVKLVTRVSHRPRHFEDVIFLITTKRAFATWIGNGQAYNFARLEGSL